MKKIHVHFMGMGGSALAGVALLAQKMGYQVSGCDLQKATSYSKSLKEAGIDLILGHDSGHLKGVDVVAVSPAVLAVNSNHPEVAAARKRKILLTWQEFVSRYLQKDKFVIAIAGTHGKSTTTALVGLVLEEAELDPTVVVGAVLPEWRSGVRFGRSKYFVIEADEYNLNFLNYSPSVIILNNLEMDHPEYFKDFTEFKEAFKKFIKRLVSPKILIANQDDKGVIGVIREMRKENELKDIEVKFYSSKIFTLKLPGKHNLANALGVVKLAEYFGIKKRFWSKVFASFGGLSRRMELVGEVGGIKVFDDYAVHPTAIAATIAALRQKYPRQKLWAIFEPHQYSRLRLFMEAFAASLKKADRVIVTGIYAGREKNRWRVKESDLVKLIGPKAVFFDDFEQIIDYLLPKLKKNDLVLVLGAGNSYLFSEQLTEKILGIKRRVGLADYTTFGIGGEADFWAEVDTEEELLALIGFARKNNLDYFILGGGSNLLIADEGYRGLVIKIKNLKFQIKNSRVVCGAGITLAELVNRAAQTGLTGLEFATGIPGTVGGAVRGNAGAWQQAIGDRIVRIRVMDSQGEFRWLEKKACCFDYRASRFKTSGEIIWEVELNLKPEKKNKIKRQMEEYLNKRSDQPGEPSAGCIFINPKLIPAGQLIDQLGFKNKTIGGAKVSEKHANFIVNTGKATAKEVIQLIEVIKKSVKKKFGVQLKEEVQLIGC
ncbi:MAG: UDP-N-acetylmuramate--L-alanine ligase [Candidatus Shapirobacteria bacterium]